MSLAMLPNKVYCIQLCTFLYLKWLTVVIPLLETCERRARDERETSKLRDKDGAMADGLTEREQAYKAYSRD